MISVNRSLSDLLLEDVGDGLNFLEYLRKVMFPYMAVVVGCISDRERRFLATFLAVVLWIVD